MKDQLLLHGGIRHIVGWLGLAYAVVFLTHLLGMFPSFFETEAVFQIGAPTFVGLVLAILYEWYLDWKKSDGPIIKKSKASYPDALCSAFGVLIAAVIAYFYGDSWVFFGLSVVFIGAAYFDRKNDFIANWYRDKLRSR